MSQQGGGKTLYDKIWDNHVVVRLSDDASLIYIDRHLVQEVSSPQAFEGLADLSCAAPTRISLYQITPFQR